MIKAVLFDMIGTTVIENDPGFMITCFEKAFLQNNIPHDINVLIANRGKNKLQMIQASLQQKNIDPGLAPKILDDLNTIVSNNLNNFSENEYVPAVFEFLRKRKIKIAIGSGLPHLLCIQIYEQLGWSKYEISYMNDSESLGKSRPNPVMIYDMMKRLQILLPKEVIKIGDTIADIREGKNAGTYTAVVLSGTQSEDELRKENPDMILNSLKDIMNINLFD